MKQIILIFCVMLTVVSCQTTQEVDHDKELRQRYQRILVHEDSLDCLDYDFTQQNIGDSNFVLYAIDKYDLRAEDASFTIKLIDQSLVKCHIDGFKRLDCFPRYLSRVSIGRDGVCAVDNEIMPLDSVAKSIVDLYGNRLGNIKLYIDKNTKLDSLNKLLIEIKNGFILNAENVSIQRFSLGIGGISDQQFDTLVQMSNYYIDLARVLN